jgi:hypothetical protein
VILGTQGGSSNRFQILVDAQEARAQASARRR